MSYRTGVNPLRLRGVPEMAGQQIAEFYGRQNRAVAYDAPLSERELRELPGQVHPALDIWADLGPWAHKLAGPFTRVGNLDLAANGSARFPVTVNTTGNFLAYSWSIAGTAIGLGNLAMDVSLGGGGQHLTQGAVHPSLIMSQGMAAPSGAPHNQPFPYPCLVPGDSSVVFEFQDLSGAPNHVEVNLHGARLYTESEDGGATPRGTPPFLPYWIPVGGLAGTVVPANGINQAVVTMDAGGDFQLCGYTAHATDPAWRYRIRSGAEGDALESDYVDAAASMGVVDRMWPLWVRPTFPRKVTLTVDLQDYSGAQNTIHLMFWGIVWLTRARILTETNR